MVGAGPAGSLCARNLAAEGYQVLLLEKRPVVGVPVRCGEATGPRQRLSHFTDIDEAWLETDIHGVIMHAAGGVSIRYDKPEIGTMLDRAKFDQDLARQAQKAGAELVVNARVSGIGDVTNGHREVRVMHEGVDTVVQARMVVGADGAESLVGRWAGFKSIQKPPEVCSAIEFRCKAVDENPNHLTFWHGGEWINAGYVWVFPKVRSGVVNIGAGQLTPKMREENVKDITERFRQKFFPEAEIEEIHGGAVPVSGTLERYVADRLLLVGDAAHHTNPLTGGGIMAGLCSAEFAAEWIHKGFRAGNLSQEFLYQYDRACWNWFGKNHLREKKIRNFVLNLPGNQQERFFRIFKSMVDGDLKGMAKWMGYARVLSLVAGNWGVTRKALRTR